MSIETPQTQERETRSVYQGTRWARELPEWINGSARNALNSIINHLPYPKASYATYARESGCSVKTITRAITKLEELGIVEVSHTGGGSGPKAINEIFINWDFLIPENASPETYRTDRQSALDALLRACYTHVAELPQEEFQATLKGLDSQFENNGGFSRPVDYKYRASVHRSRNDLKNGETISPIAVLNEWDENDPWIGMEETG